MFDALDSVTRSCYRSFLPLPDAALIDDGEVFGVTNAVPIAFFNGIATTRLRDGTRIAGIADLYREKRRAFRWWVTPGVTPAGLDALLLANGFRHAYDCLGMTADLGTLRAARPTDLRIRKVRDEEEMRTFFAVSRDVFQQSEEDSQAWRTAYSLLGYGEDAPWAHFLGYAGDTPVATTSVLLDGDLAGIYLVGTLAAARERGAGAALTLHAMQHARDRGARTAALQSSKMGEGVYRSVGFADGPTLGLFEWRPE